jgi:GT2 family glycosyltransferase
MIKSAPRLSVVIPTYRRRDSVERALSALAQQSVSSADFDVVVSIDGSDDGTRELLEGYQAPYALRSVWRPNRGRAAALNAGIGQAAGDVLVLLDDDMEPAPEFLAGHCRAHGVDSRRGVMGAAPIPLDAGSPPLVAAYIGPKFNEHLVKLAEPGHRNTLRDFYSGNFSIRREVLLEVGLFDEAFKIYGNEDLELAYRLRQAGVTLAYAAEALAYQHYTKDFAALARDTISKGQTAVLLASKHPETIAELQLSAYANGSRRWRWLRASLLGLSRQWVAVPEGVAAGIGWLERRRVKGLQLYYRLALDYFYWVGAEAALRENKRFGRGLRSLAGLVHS